MIKPHCHSLEWITEQRNSLRAVDPLILEKAIFALTLLDQLVAAKLDFVFKGGTALLLHIPSPRRLSIDIDITCEIPKAELESSFEPLISSSPFTRWDEHVRGERGLPGRHHYRFYYQSPTQERELNILLDVVTEPNHIANLIEKPILTPFLEATDPLTVKTPCLESLLGDKLTAFAPHTIGVPLTESFSQQVIKQLFDIGQLYEHVNDLHFFTEDNHHSFLAESSYTSTFDGEYHDYLDDVIDTGYRICALDLKGAPTDRPEDDQLLKNGIRQLSNHLIGSKFSLPHAKAAAARAAPLASILKSGNLPTSLPFFDASAIEQIRTAFIHPQYQVLNRLKGSHPEAFFFWSKHPDT